VIAPGANQGADILRVDLVKRRVFGPARISSVGRPFRGTLGEQMGGANGEQSEQNITDRSLHKVLRPFTVRILAWRLCYHFASGVPCRFTQTVPRLTKGSSPSEIWVRSR
jgi:hypothetical protein